MNKLYREKLEAAGFNAERIEPKRIYTSEEGWLRWGVRMDVDVFKELGPDAPVSSLNDAISNRVCAKYGVLTDDFEVLGYQGVMLNGKHWLFVTVKVDPLKTSPFILAEDEWVN